MKVASDTDVAFLKSLINRINEQEDRIKELIKQRDAALKTAGYFFSDKEISAISGGEVHIVGPRGSIDKVSAALHYYDQMESTRKGYLLREKALKDNIADLRDILINDGVCGV